MFGIVPSLSIGHRPPDAPLRAEAAEFLVVYQLALLGRCRISAAVPEVIMRLNTKSDLVSGRLPS